MDLQSKIHNFLQGATQGAQNFFKPVTNEVQQLPQQTATFGQHLLQGAANTPLFQVPGLPTAPNPTTPMTVGNTLVPFVQNRVIQPAMQAAPALLNTIPGYAATHPTNVPTQGKQLLGGLQTFGNLLAPEVNLGFAAFGGAKGALNALRTGQNPTQGFQQGFSGQNEPGLGTSLLGNNNLLATGLNAAELAAPLIHGQVNGLKSVSPEIGALGLRGVHPDAFNLGDTAASRMSDFIAAVRGPHYTGGMNPQLQRDAQDIAEHVLPGYIHSDNQKLANAFEYLLNTRDGIRNNNIPMPRTDVGYGQQFGIPKMGITGNSEPLPWEFNSTQKLPVEPNLGPGSLHMPENLTPQPKEPFVAPTGTIQDAIASRQGVQTNITQRANVLKQLLDKGIQGDKETALFRDTIEHPENLDNNLMQVGNKPAFMKAVQNYSDFTDYAHNLATKNGVPLNYIKDYYSHILDLSDPAEAQRFQQFAASKNANGYFTKERIFKDINELQANGFKLKNPNVPLDVQAYANSANRTIGSAAMTKGLEEAAPGKVVNIENTGMVPRGFKQLRIPGMEGTAVDEEVYKHIAHLEAPPDKNPLLNAFDKINQAGKDISLFGGGFHALKTTLRQIGYQTLNFKIPRLDEAFVSAISPAARLARDQRAIADGTVEKAARMGVTLDGGNDVGAEKNILQQGKGLMDTVHNSLFSGLIKSYKLQLVRDTNIESMNPEEARQVGAQINNLMGGLNLPLIGRSQVTQQWLRRFALAPDFNEGKLRQLATAANPLKWGADAGFARKAILGEALAVGALAEIGSKLATGSFMPLQQALLNPDIKTNMKNPKGQQQDVGLPGSTITDINRARQDPMHFLTARGSSAISAGTKLVTGKDYYGNPLVDTNKEPDTVLNRLKAVAGSEAPIPVVQTQKYLAGKVTKEQAALNTLGFRVHTDQSDPTVQHFANRDAALKNLNPAETAAYTTLSNKAFDPNDPENRIYKANLLLRYPAVFQALQQNALADSQGNQGKVDPLYTTDPTTAKQLLRYETLPPGSPDGKQLLKDNPNIIALQQARSQYFSANPIANNQTTPPPQPSAYAQQQMNAGQWRDPQVQAYLNAHNTYVNQQRAALGLSPIQPTTGSSSTSRGPFRPYGGIAFGLHANSKGRIANPLHFTRNKSVNFTGSKGIRRTTTARVMKSPSFKKQAAKPIKTLSYKGKPFHLKNTL